jgi:predicted Zn-ribbon and HTH transcriptional regulator
LIFACKSCGFLFERSTRPGNCPDCGKEQQVEYANIHEKIAYLKGKEERIEDAMFAGGFSSHIRLYRTSQMEPCLLEFRQGEK